MCEYFTCIYENAGICDSKNCETECNQYNECEQCEYYMNVQADWCCSVNESEGVDS